MTHEQDVVATKSQLANLKADYMNELMTYLALTNDASSERERRAAIVRCQQKGTAYFNYVEEFVGNSDLLGAHESPLWAQGFAEDCAEILRSIPGHIDFLVTAFHSARLECSLGHLIPGPTAYANMQRMVVKYLTTSVQKSIRKQFEEVGLPVYGFKNEARDYMSQKHRIYLSSACGFVLVIMMLVISLLRPEPSTFQYSLWRTVTAIAGAGLIAVVPGFIEVKFGRWLRAGGALGVFVILYFYNPALPTASQSPKVALPQAQSSAR